MQPKTEIILSNFPSDWVPNTLTLQFHPPQGRQLQCEVELEGKLYTISGWYATISVPFHNTMPAYRALIRGCDEDYKNATVRFWLDNSGLRAQALQIVDSSLVHLASGRWGEIVPGQQRIEFQIEVPLNSMYALAVEMLSGPSERAKLRIDGMHTYRIPPEGLLVSGAHLREGRHMLSLNTRDALLHARLRWIPVIAPTYSGNVQPVVSGSSVNYYYSHIPVYSGQPPLVLPYNFVLGQEPALVIGNWPQNRTWQKDSEIILGAHSTITGQVKSGQEAVFALPLTGDAVILPEYSVGVFVESAQRQSWSWRPVDSIVNGYANFRTRHFSSGGLFLSPRVVRPLELVQPQVAMSLLVADTHPEKLILNHQKLESEEIVVLARAIIASNSNAPSRVGSASDADKLRAAEKAQTIRARLEKLKNATYGHFSRQNLRLFELPEPPAWLQAWYSQIRHELYADMTPTEGGDPTMKLRDISAEGSLAGMVNGAQNLNMIVLDAYFAQKYKFHPRFTVLPRECQDSGRAIDLISFQRQLIVLQPKCQESVRVYDRLTNQTYKVAHILSPFQRVFRDLDRYNECDGKFWAVFCIEDMKDVQKGLEIVTKILENDREPLFETDRTLFLGTLLAQMNEDFHYHYRDLLIKMARYQKRYAKEFFRLNSGGDTLSNNITLKTLATTHYVEQVFLAGTSEASESHEYIVSSLRSLVELGGAFVEGNGYALFALQDLLPAYALPLIHRWKKQDLNSVPGHLQDLGDYLINLALETGRLPEMNDGNAGIKAWLAPFAVLNQREVFRTWQDRFGIPNTLGEVYHPHPSNPQNILAYRNPSYLNIRDARVLLSYPLRLEPWGDSDLTTSRERYFRAKRATVGTVFGYPGPGQPVHSVMHVVSKGSHGQTRARGHDQQDNGSVSLTYVDPNTNLSYNLIQDLGYPGYDKRTQTSSYCDHNVVALPHRDHCGARPNRQFTISEAIPFVPNNFNNWMDDASAMFATQKILMTTFWSVTLGLGAIFTSWPRIPVNSEYERQCREQYSTSIKGFTNCVSSKKLYHSGELTAGIFHSLFGQHQNDPDPFLHGNGIRTTISFPDGGGYTRNVFYVDGDYFVVDQLDLQPGEASEQRFHLPYSTNDPLSYFFPIDSLVANNAITPPVFNGLGVRVTHLWGFPSIQDISKELKQGEFQGSEQLFYRLTNSTGLNSRHVATVFRVLENSSPVVTTWENYSDCLRGSCAQQEQGSTKKILVVRNPKAATVRVQVGSQYYEIDHQISILEFNSQNVLTKTISVRK